MAGSAGCIRSGLVATPPLYIQRSSAPAGLPPGRVSAARLGWVFLDTEGPGVSRCVAHGSLSQINQNGVV